VTLLSAREVHAGYGTLEVLHGIDFEVNEGELVAVLGPNGAGKSSLLGCLARTVRTYSGSISWEGESLLSKRTSDVSAMGIAFVPQDANVFSDLSVRENIAVAVSAMATRSEKALRAKQAAESVFDRFPFLRSREHQPARLSPCPWHSCKCHA
jgi:branched-chain amino acid transport system ATP-binding protein